MLELPTHVTFAENALHRRMFLYQLTVSFQLQSIVVVCETLPHL